MSGKEVLSGANLALSLSQATVQSNVLWIGIHETGKENCWSSMLSSHQVKIWFSDQISILQRFRVRNFVNVYGRYFYQEYKKLSTVILMTAGTCSSLLSSIVNLYLYECLKVNKLISKEKFMHLLTLIPN